MTTTTPNMNLILPDVSVTAGPQWATLLNAAYALIDSHDHSSGKGALVTPAGLNISSDLTFAQNNATNLRTVRLYPNGSFSPISADKTCLYANGGELFYIDALGNNVQITLNGSVDVSGSITALSLKDSSFFIQYFGDITRQFRFNASAIPTGTTRILSVPDSGGNDSFITAAATQTLTNKTLTAPTIASINTGSVTFTLPATDGSGGQAIVTNASGVLSFGNATAVAATVNTAGSITREATWTTYTPTITGAGTATAITGFYKVLGDSLFIRVTFTSGSSTAVPLAATLPGGFTLNTAHVRAGTSPAGNVSYSATAARSLTALVNSTSTGSIFIGAQGSVFPGLTPANGSDIVGSGDTISIFAEIPI